MSLISRAIQAVDVGNLRNRIVEIAQKVLSSRIECTQGNVLIGREGVGPGFTSEIEVGTGLTMENGVLSAEGGGASSWNDLTGTANHVPFDITTSSVPTGDGVLFWDTDEQCLSYRVPGGSSEINKEIWDYYTNIGNPAMVDGDMVSVAGVSGGRTAVLLTDFSDEASVKACVGMITYGGAKNARVRVTKIGAVKGLDLAGPDEGKPLYGNITTPGKWQTTEPTTGWVVAVGVARVVNPGTSRTNVVDVNLNIYRAVSSIGMELIQSETESEARAEIGAVGVDPFTGTVIVSGVGAFPPLLYAGTEYGRPYFTEDGLPESGGSPLWSLRHSTYRWVLSNGDASGSWINDSGSLYPPLTGWVVVVGTGTPTLTQAGTLGDTYTNATDHYVYDGAKWNRIPINPGTTGEAIYRAEGEIAAQGAIGLPAGTAGKAVLASETLPPQLLKTNRMLPVLTVDGTTIRISQDISVRPGNSDIYTFAAASEVVPASALVGGRDYVVTCSSYGELAVEDYTSSDAAWLARAAFSPAGIAAAYPYYPGTDRFIIGGFHYAPIANAELLAIAAGETALPAVTVPADKYAAWRLAVGVDGSVTAVAASANATGYADLNAALNALPAQGAAISDKAAFGYVVVRAVGAPFVAGTDALPAAATSDVATRHTRYFAGTNNATLPFYGITPTLSQGVNTASVAYTTFNTYCGSSGSPAINPFSFWDMNFRPACADPRGMALVGGKCWIDLYLTNQNTDTFGTSSYAPANARLIADGENSSTPAIIPSSLWGNGSLRFPNQDWYASTLLLGAYGKKLMTLEEYSLAAVGAVQGSVSGGNPQVAAISKLTSRFGLMQASGAMWVWSSDAGNDNDKRALMGGHWGHGGSAGARDASWSYSAPASLNDFGLRGRGDHVIS